MDVLPSRTLTDNLSEPVRARSRPLMLLLCVIGASAVFGSLSLRAAVAVDQALKATLPDGSTVELLGITAMSVHRSWWNADGSPRDKPVDVNIPFDAAPSGVDGPFVVIRTDSPLSNTAFLSLDDAVTHATSATGSDTWRVTCTVGKFADDLTKTNVRVSFGAGEPGPWCEILRNGELKSDAHDVHDIPVELRPWYELWQPRLLVPFEQQTRVLLGEFDARKYSVGFEAELVGNDGTIHAMGQHLQHRHQPMDNEEKAVAFDVDLSKIACCRYRIVPRRHWVTFHDVSLRLGAKTKPSVSTQQKTPSPSDRGLPPELLVRKSDHSPATFNHVIPAARGFAEVQKLPNWMGWNTRYEFVPLTKLPDGDHLLLVGPDFPDRTVHPITLPNDHHILRRQQRTLVPWPQSIKVGRTTTDAYSFKVRVDTAEAVREVIVLDVTNHQAQTIEIRQGDVSLSVQEFRIMEPAILLDDSNKEIHADGTSELKCLVEQGETKSIRIDWKECVRTSIWARHAMNGPVPPPASGGKISVTAWLRNHGALPVRVTDPKLIVSQKQTVNPAGPSLLLGLLRNGMKLAADSAAPPPPAAPSAEVLHLQKQLAAGTLADIVDENDVEPLIQAIEFHDAKLRRWAGAALSRYALRCKNAQFTPKAFSDPDVVRRLVKLVETEGVTRGFSLSMPLALIPKKQRQPLVDAVATPDVRVRIAIYNAWFSVHDGDTRMVPALLNSIAVPEGVENSEPQPVRERSLALRVLANHLYQIDREEVLPLVLSRLSDTHEDVRYSACYLLERVPTDWLTDPRPVPLLVKTLQTESDWSTRIGSIQALGRFADNVAVDPLLRLLQNDQPFERNGRHHRSEMSTQSVAVHDRSLHENICRALADIGDVRAIPVLRERLPRKEPHVIEALENLNDQNSVP